MTGRVHGVPQVGEGAEQRMRVDLAAAYRLIHRLGLDDSIYTHISVCLSHAIAALPHPGPAVRVPGTGKDRGEAARFGVLTGRSG